MTATTSTTTTTQTTSPPQIQLPTGDVEINNTTATTKNLAHNHILSSSQTTTSQRDPLDELFLTDEDDDNNNNHHHHHTYDNTHNNSNNGLYARLVNRMRSQQQQQQQPSSSTLVLASPSTIMIQQEPCRQGTVSSARFNMWSTMVGGGCLSLPLAMQKTGNIVVGPILLILTAFMTEFCFNIMIDTTRTMMHLSQPLPSSSLLPNRTTRSTTTITTAPNNEDLEETETITTAPTSSHRPAYYPFKKNTYEGIAAAAFGTTMYKACTVLVTLMCFFGIVGYTVLLRDMLEPVTDAIFHNVHRGMSGPAWQDNFIVLVVVLVVTPLCTLQNLTSLKRFGAASMASVGILGLCMIYRSLQCTLGISKHQHSSHYSILDGFRFFPDNWKDVLDVIPLYISCYVCHYNIPVVHNELQDPTPERVKWWLKSTVWGSTLFYLTLGIAGSAYGACAPEPRVHGNILLDFDEHDPLLLVGRMCLAITITLAFPMLTIPARDILIRWHQELNHRNSIPVTIPTSPGDSSTTTNAAALREPLLPQEPIVEENLDSLPVPVRNNDEEQPDEVVYEPIEGTVSVAAVSVPVQASSPAIALETAPAFRPASLKMRLVASIVVFWTGAALATSVSSIDIVWGLLGSSLSIMLSYLIPCGSYLVISRRKEETQDSQARMINRLSTMTAWLLILLFVPLMFVSTANAIYNTFFH